MEARLFVVHLWMRRGNCPSLDFLLLLLFVRCVAQNPVLFVLDRRRKTKIAKKRRSEGSEIKRRRGGQVICGRRSVDTEALSTPDGGTTVQYTLPASNALRPYIRASGEGGGVEAEEMKKSASDETEYRKPG